MEVSVVIPTYNQGRYLEQALQSSLCQTRRARQVIVVNDGSSDETADICARYRNQIVYIEQENGGPSAARNAGIAQSESDAVVFLDADDLLHTRWLERAVQTWRREDAKGRNVGLVYGDHILFDDTGTLRRKVHVKPRAPFDFWRGPGIFSSGTLVTKACLDGVGGFDVNLRMCEDWDYWLRVLFSEYRLIRVPAYATLRRRHSASLTSDDLLMLRGRAEVLRMWAESDDSAPETKRAMQQEYARNSLRLRRAAHYRGLPHSRYVRDALETDSSIIVEPWVYIYGGVYPGRHAAKRMSSDQVMQSLQQLDEEIKGALRIDRGNRKVLRRLRATKLLAQAIDQGFRSRYVSAATLLLSATRADPTLVPTLGLLTWRRVATFAKGASL